MLDRTIPSYLLCVICACLMGLWSCQTEPAQTTTAVPTTPAPTDTTSANTYRPGQLYKAVAIASLPEETYALYLPHSYPNSQNWPVYICLDPQADGKKPVAMYQALADSFGFILIGSNVNKNGMPVTETRIHVLRLLDDARKKLSIDPTLIHFMGFSGGARAAVDVGLNYPNTAGVIGCGAGFPPSVQIKAPNFFYIGIAGKRDFNYPEMHKQMAVNEGKMFLNHLLLWEGAHAWPPDSVMREAFKGTVLMQMQQGRMPMDEVKIKQWMAEEQQALEALRSSHAAYDQYKLCEKVMTFYPKGTAGRTDFESGLQKAAASASYKAYLSQLNKTFQQEKERERTYAAAIRNQSVEWWQQEVQNNLSPALKSPDALQAASNARILGFLSLVVYSNANQAFQTNRLAIAQRFTAIYAIVDPTNPEQAYMEALRYARLNDPAKAKANLLKAINMGFQDIDRMKESVDLVNLMNDPVVKQRIDSVAYYN